jgi:hypothetical protein
MTSIIKVDQIQSSSGTGGFSVEANPSVFRVHQSVSQTTTSGSNATVNFQTKDFDPNNWFDTSTNRFTPTIAGYYHVTASIRWNTSVDWDICDLYLFKNSSVYMSYSDAHQRYDNLVVTGLVYLNGTTDYLEVVAFQVSGSNKDIRNYSQETFFCGHRVIG